MGDGSELFYSVGDEIVPADEATIPIRDRGFLYGDAAFETLRAYNGSVFRWGAHADRLQNTCDLIGLDHGWEQGELQKRITEVLDANDFSEAYIRLSITRGVQPGKLTPQPPVDPTVVVIASELPRSGVDGTTTWDGVATAEIVDVKRVPDDAVPAKAKTHNYLNGILARNAIDEDSDEGIMVDSQGYLAEGATSNLFFVDEGVLKTPTLTGAVLPGITRDVVLKLATELDIPFEEGRYRPTDLVQAEEAFFTNTTWEIRPIRQVDGTEFDNDGVCQELRTAFLTLIEEEFY